MVALINGGNYMLFTIITDQEKHLPLYITGIGVQKNQEAIMRPNGYPYYQWTYCAKGEGVLIIDGKEFKITEGTGFFFSPKIPHEYYPLIEPWETYWLNFEGYGLPAILDLFNIKKWEVFNPLSIENTLEQFNEIADALLVENPEKVIETSANLYAFLLVHKMSRKINAHQQYSNRSLQLKPVLLFIEANYCNYITLDDMASLIHITTNHLCKLFKANFGLTPFQYLIQVRIQRSKQLLIQFPELQINEITKLVGYGDTSYFCSIFKKQEQVTPLEFRKMYGV